MLPSVGHVVDIDNPKMTNLVKWIVKTVGPLLASGNSWRVTINGSGGNAMDIKAEVTRYEVLRM